MKPYLQVEDLTKSYGDRMLFDSITFGVNEGDKIGVIAKNGTGKSTLLRILSGEEAPDSGNITYRNDLRVGFLQQNPVFIQGMTIMENLITAIPEHDHEEWDKEDRVKQMLSQLGIDNPHASVDANVSRCSWSHMIDISLTECATRLSRSILKRYLHTKAISTTICANVRNALKL